MELQDVQVQLVNKVDEPRFLSLMHIPITGRPCTSALSCFTHFLTAESLRSMSLQIWLTLKP